MWAIAQQLGPTKHVSMAFGPMHRVAEKPAKGVTAIGYTVSFTLKSPKRNVSALFAWVILGAGRAAFDGEGREGGRGGLDREGVYGHG